MDEFVKEVLVNLPNFAGLLLMLIWQQRRIDQLLASQEKLVDEILALKEVVRANGSSG
jgi:hypothetical protein